MLPEFLYYNRMPPVPDQYHPSIFLAGPTPRDSSTSWRSEARKIFEEIDFQGNILIPEPADGSDIEIDYEQQVRWEWKGLERSDCILFWVPRELETLPGFTTNIEFGAWYQSGKVVLGSPDDAVKMRYMKHCAKVYNIPVYSDLKSTISTAIFIANSNKKANAGKPQMLVS